MRYMNGLLSKVNMTNEQIRKRCEVLLIAMLGKEHAISWWTRSNKHFKGETPEAVFERAPDEVYQYLMNCAQAGW